jgi:SAM-dependent methyltransferase
MSNDKRTILETNKAAWEKVAEKFAGGLYLPAWGPFGELRHENLLGEIKGKTFLEVGFGSGHSIQYLMQNGAEKVYGVDISEAQLRLATELNKLYMEQGKVILNVAAMEETLPLPEQVDVVFSVYGIGWTTDIKTAFSNIKSSLKPKGKFVWSWEHPFYSRFTVEDHKLIMDKPYLTENARFVPDWVGSSGAYLQHRKVSTWFNALQEAGFKIENLYEPDPEVFKETSEDPTRYYSVFRAQLVTPTIIFDCTLL